MTDRELVLMDINKVYDLQGREGIRLDIPRTNKTMAGMPGMITTLNDAIIM